MPIHPTKRLLSNEPEADSLDIITARDATTARRHLQAVTPTPDNDEVIPDPTQNFVRALAAHAFEAVEGTRTIAQLGPAVTFKAARLLAEQRKIHSDRRAMYQDRRTCAPSPGRLHLCRVLPRLAHASVTIHTGLQSHAVSLRLEWSHGRWRADELYVL